MFAGVLLSMAVAATTAAAAEPLTIRVGWAVPITDWALFMLEKRELATHFGKSYVMEPVHFTSSPSVVTALASNDVDVGNLAFSTLAIAIENAGMRDLRVISDLFQDGVGGHYTNEFFVRQDGGITDVESLKGKVIATPGIGGAIDIAMRAMLRRHGLEDKRDYTMIEASLPAMGAMLAERKVDMVPGVPPFSFNPDLRQVGRVLFTQKDALGVSQMIVWTARQPFLENNRAPVIDFMEDTLRVVHWYLDPVNHDAAVVIAAKLTKQPAERFAAWLFAAGDYYRDPNMLPNLQALQANVDLQRDIGFLKEPLDIKEFVDLSLVEEAAQRLH